MASSIEVTLPTSCRGSGRIAAALNANSPSESSPPLAPPLRQAWAEAKTAARVAAIPAEIKADRIAVLTDAITVERFNDHWPSARANIAATRAEIQKLL